MTHPPRARSIALLRDIQATLDTVLRHDKWPAIVRLPSAAAAIRWRHKAHTLRSILRQHEEIAQKLVPGSGSSPFDHLVLRLEGTKVIIDLRRPNAVLEIDGQPVEPTSNLGNFTK